MGIGVHLLLDVFGVDAERLTDADTLGGALIDAAAAASMTPLSAPIVHVFPGGGLTALLPLAESHIAIHTYPERGYLAGDIFTCGPPGGAEDAACVLLSALGNCRAVRRTLTRGEEPPE